ncbi:thiamine pyrophosphate-dependent enzyme [Marinomonas posidonica]|uniref:alpha-ketoacid dehydrogenase subunit alpha/beta n=1 Tax=Marinomonas posidonica TaxID=936476 RepID=UPI003736A2A3
MNNIVSKFREEIRKALLCREVELKLLDLFSEGYLTGTVHTSIGQEITSVLISKYLKSSDYKFSNHRGHSHYLALTDDLEGMIMELLGKTKGCSGGVGGSQHLYNKEKNFFSNGIQGGMAPIAAGVAYKLKSTENISVIFIGDGTLGQGVLYESLNVSGIYDLPILFICEDNGMAQSTPTEFFKLNKLKNRVEGFSIRYDIASTDDWEELDKKLDASVSAVREGKPTFLHIKTRRLKSHSKGDDNRSDQEIKDLNDYDVLNCLMRDNETIREISDSIKSEVRVLVDTLMSEDDLKFVSRYEYVRNIDYNLESIEFFNRKVKDRLYEIIEGVLFNDGVFVGEDIRNRISENGKQYGGAFKVSLDLSDKYEKVINFPIAEQSIVGFATGYALAGGQAVSEIMFGDFMTLALDQIIQHISKIKTMYGTNISLPIVIRSPMGGRRGYGPTHSQSIERLFLGVEKVSCAFVNKYSPIDEIVKKYLEEGEPLILFEHKLNYSKKDFFELNENHRIKISDDFSRTIIISPLNKRPKYTVFTYGYSLELIEELLINNELDPEFEIVCPTVISPVNSLPLKKSVIKTGKLITFEEGSSNLSLGEAMISELCKSSVKFELVATIGNATTIPAAKDGETYLLDSYKDILKVL